MNHNYSGNWENINKYVGRKIFHGRFKVRRHLLDSHIARLANAEAVALERAYKLTDGMSPKFYRLETVERKGYWYIAIVMERIHGILAQDYFGNAIDWSFYSGNLKSRLCAFGVDHLDLNPRNVFITKDGPRVIDWDATYIDFLEDK